MSKPYAIERRGVFKDDGSIEWGPPTLAELTEDELQELIRPAPQECSKEEIERVEDAIVAEATRQAASDPGFIDSAGDVIRREGATRVSLYGEFDLNALARAIVGKPLKVT